ncbi:UDP-2-acetamido-2-deoxy-3-oxo-D-glucuronate aminotransferase [Rubritalea halochordaticola]|uniref:UDP-2-acetamido-2-deoxy-3-oxo-D-glucuronate aminotransferase n=1 Tax=Rubritalea halochordaticola TaxID=714537 RepID=A0ABP9V238_9BACT
MEFIDLKSQQALIRADLEKRIMAVLDHGRYIMGPELEEMEQRLADYTGAKHCIGVASGTDSLLIALMALGIGPGDEVITVPYTWISTAEMIALAGATPVFVDIQEDTWNMDPTLLEAAITEKTKAIMPVGIYGQTADMTAINAIAAKYDLPVIEDAAQSFGATHHGSQSCNLATIGSTSFFPSKPLGCYGDGGALFTNDDELADLMKQIRVHGQKEKHHHPVLGVNGRLDSIQAAVVLSKMSLFDAEVAKRQEVADKYSQAISQSDFVKSGLQLPLVADGNTSVWAQYTMLSPDRDALHERLQAAGVPAVSYYAVPLHLQPVFAGLGHKAGDFPVTERVASQGISLPMNPYLKDEEIDQVVAAFDAQA